MDDQGKSESIAMVFKRCAECGERVLCLMGGRTPTKCSDHQQGGSP